MSIFKQRRKLSILREKDSNSHHFGIAVTPCGSGSPGPGSPLRAWTRQLASCFVHCTKHSAMTMTTTTTTKPLATARILVMRCAQTTMLDMTTIPMTTTATSMMRTTGVQKNYRLRYASLISLETTVTKTLGTPLTMILV